MQVLQWPRFCVVSTSTPPEPPLLAGGVTSTLSTLASTEALVMVGAPGTLQKWQGRAGQGRQQRSGTGCTITELPAQVTAAAPACGAVHPALRFAGGKAHPGTVNTKGVLAGPDPRMLIATAYSLYCVPAVCTPAAKLIFLCSRSTASLFQNADGYPGRLTVRATWQPTPCQQSTPRHALLLSEQHSAAHLAAALSAQARHGDVGTSAHRHTDNAVSCDGCRGCGQGSTRCAT